MKIIDARSDKYVTGPITLGESGRGRHLEVVPLSNRPAQAPSDPGDVGYFVHGAPPERQHAVLTCPTPSQKGILLRINTKGRYTRDSDGRIALVGGPAKLLTRGTWAEGDAGRLGSGPDELWHVGGPSLFEFVIQGGPSKGGGFRWLVVAEDLSEADAGLESHIFTPAELQTVIMTASHTAVEVAVRRHMQAILTTSGGSTATNSYRADLFSALVATREVS